MVENTPQSTGLAIIPSRINESSRRIAVVRSQVEGESSPVVHLSFDEVRQLAEAAHESGRGLQDKERDKLLIMTLMDGCFRVSEAVGTTEAEITFERNRAKKAISAGKRFKPYRPYPKPGIRPRDLTNNDGGWQIRIMGKGGRPGVVGVSPQLAAQLQAYAYRWQLAPDSRFFDLTRARAWQVITRAFDAAGLRRPSVKGDRVGAVHILRHTGAIERLKVENPKAVQDQLRHASARMTLRYMKTLSAEESLRTNKGVEYQW